MKKSAVLALFLVLLASVNSFSSLKIESVLSDMKNPTNMIDRNPGTYSEGRAGSNVIILQLGNLKYVNEIKLVLRDPVRLKYFQIDTSDNFIEWRNIIGKNEVSGAALDFSFEKEAAQFVRIVVISDVEFRVQEIEVFDAASPANRIMDVKVSDIRETTATIRWQTRIKSQGTVLFQKKMNGILQTLMEADFHNEHSVRLTGLLKGTDYIYRIVSQSPDGTRIESGQLEFRTRGVPLPDIWELKALSITPFTAKISYLANIPTRYEVQFGTSTNGMKTVITGKNWKDRDTFDLLGLQPESTYFYRLIVKDRIGNVTMTPVIPFSTPAYNIALGKKTAGTFNFVDEEIRRLGYGDSTVDKVVDGNLRYFGGMAVSFNAQNADQYVVIDLEKPEPIKRLDVYWWGLSFSRDYRIDLSIDGNEWVMVAQRLDARKGVDKPSPGGDVMVQQTVPMNKTARFVRLFVQAGAKRGTLNPKWPPRQNLYLMELAVIKDTTKN